MYVYLPPGYRRDRRYPVLYLLHGSPGGPGSFVTAVPAPMVEDELLAQRRIHPLILVMPQGTPDPATETAWVDGVASGSAWETFLSRDVVHLVDACFATDATGHGRGLAGLSDGGYAALNIAFHHPGQFDLVESWSGYQHADPSLTTVYGSDSRRIAYDSPAVYLTHVAAELRRQGVFVWQYIGSRDSALTETTSSPRNLQPCASSTPSTSCLERTTSPLSTADTCRLHCASLRATSRPVTRQPLPLLARRAPPTPLPGPVPPRPVPCSACRQEGGYASRGYRRRGGVSHRRPGDSRRDAPPTTTKWARPVTRSSLILNVRP